ncbi:MAG: HNH endonuclease [Promethearchaeota archaeon]|jgi:hypothetical protein
MAKKKKKKPLITVSMKDIGDGKVEITSFGGGIIGIRRRSRTAREKSDIHKRRQWERCLDYFRNRCAYCLRKPIGEDKPLTKDHFIPKSKNGRNSGTNLVPACTTCNTVKDNLHPHKWCNEEQLERIYTYFWDFRIRMFKKGRHTVVWKAIGLGE